MTPSGSSPVPKQLQKFVQRIETNASRSGRPEKVARLYGAWSACYVRYCTMTNRDWRVHRNAPYFLRYLQSEQEVGSPSLRRAAEGLLFVFEEMMGRELGAVSWRPPSGDSSQTKGSQTRGSQTTSSGADASSGSSREEADDEASSSAGPDQGSMLTRLLFHTSLPIQEAMDLRVGDVDLEAGMIYVSDALGTPKHIVEIPDAIGDALATHIREVRRDNPADPLDAPLFQANALKGRTAEADTAADEQADASTDAPDTSSPAPAEADPDDDRRSLWQYAES
jgi:hypothetical protein